MTNAITVVVRDNGPGLLATTQTFLVTVGDTLADFVVHVGTTNLLAGDSGFVVVTLSSGVPLTNVSFTLTADEASLTNLVLQPTASGLASASLERVATNLFRLAFVTHPGAALQGTQELARLLFATRPGGDSAMVWLRAEQLTGLGANTGCAATEQVGG